MSTSENEKKNANFEDKNERGKENDNAMKGGGNIRSRKIKNYREIYVGVSIFCFVFFLVYDRFSHGVHSPYMTWLFLWPFLLGAVPSAIFWNIKSLPEPGRFCVNLYNSGVAAVTVSSLLRGIFEIAGTGSVYQERLMVFGGAMLAGGIVAYFCRR